MGVGAVPGECRGMQGNARGTYGYVWNVPGECRGTYGSGCKVPWECRGMQGNVREM